jgi:hypothetical protein
LPLPGSPSLTSAGSAPLEFMAVPVLDDHIVSRERVAELAEFELCADDRALQSVMGRVAAGLPDTSWDPAGKNPMAGRDDAYERLPEQTRGGALARAATKDSIAFLAERPAPHPASAPGDRDALHKARFARDFHPRPSFRSGPLAAIAGEP